MNKIHGHNDRPSDRGAQLYFSNVSDPYVIGAGIHAAASVAAGLPLRLVSKMNHDAILFSE
jgi:hypothetical protein